MTFALGLRSRFAERGLLPIREKSRMLFRCTLFSSLRKFFITHPKRLLRRGVGDSGEPSILSTCI